MQCRLFSYVRGNLGMSKSDGVLVPCVQGVLKHREFASTKKWDFISVKYRILKTAICAVHKVLIQPKFATMWVSTAGGKWIMNFHLCYPYDGKILIYQ